MERLLPTQAYSRFRDSHDLVTEGSRWVQAMALAHDWLYPFWTADERERIEGWLATELTHWVDTNRLTRASASPFRNDAARGVSGLVLAALTLYDVPEYAGVAQRALAYAHPYYEAINAAHVYAKYLAYARASLQQHFLSQQAFNRFSDSHDLVTEGSRFVQAMALAHDWLYPNWTADERAAIEQWLATELTNWVDTNRIRRASASPFRNDAARGVSALVLGGLTLYDVPEQAGVARRALAYAQPYYDAINAAHAYAGLGGGMAEGTFYGNFTAFAQTLTAEALLHRRRRTGRVHSLTVLRWRGCATRSTRAGQVISPTSSGTTCTSSRRSSAMRGAGPPDRRSTTAPRSCCSASASRARRPRARRTGP